MTAMADARCKCEKCESRTHESYVLEATCTNCDSQVLVKLRHGDKKPLMVECSKCGVYGMPIWRGMWDGHIGRR